MRPAEEVSAFFESKALYGGSPVAAPSYMDTAPKGGSGGTEKKSGGGLFGIKKLFGGKKLKFMDDDFVTEWDPGEGGIFSLSGNTDVLDAEEFC